jgi:hypothetical protein
MKTWQWIALGGTALVIIVLIFRNQTIQQNGAVNPTVTAAAGLGGLLAGLFNGGKVSAPAATATSIPGDTGYSYNGLSGQQYGAAYSSAFASTGEAASRSAGPASGDTGTAFASASTGQPASSDALGVGTLQAPSFDIGTSGADFSN